MELAEPLSSSKHKWLEWAGLREPPPDAETWEPVARAFEIDDPQTGTSSVAARLVDELKAAGIEAQQREYEIDTTEIGRYFISGGLRTHIAVGVHNRDLTRATEIAVAFKRELDHDEQVGEQLASDAELQQESLDDGGPDKA